jgi:hypothetical protein
VWSGKRDAPEYGNLEQARNAALSWLEKRGFKVEKLNPAKFGNHKFNGMTNIESTLGYRVEYDNKHGAHINVFDKSKKGFGGKSTFTFGGSKSLVDTIKSWFNNK